MVCSVGGGGGGYDVDCTQYRSVSWGTTCTMGYFPDPAFGWSGGIDGITPSNPLTATQTFLNNIDATKLKPCMQLILGDVKNLSNGSVAGIIQQFFGNIPGYNGNLKDGTLAAGVNGQTGSYDRSINSVTTTFDSQKFSNASDLSIARTMLHESVHAFLVSYFAYDPLNATIAYSDMLTLWNNTQKPNLNDIQHNQMTLDFMNSIALALMEYGNNKGYIVSDPHFYSDMAWGGLTHDSKGNLTSLFKTLVPNASDRQRILDTLTSELNQTDFNGNPKPSIEKKAGC